MRYPGGKSKLTSLIHLFMQNSENDCRTYIEPFAGGAGVALSLLLENKVDKIVINDYDKAIYSFWRAVKEDTCKLIKLIEETPVSVEEWKEQKNIYVNNNKKYSIELAFAAFYLNRTNRSGVLNGGLIGGMDQTGNYLIDARYNKSDLIRRIELIAKRKRDISVYGQEIRTFITHFIPKYQEQGFVYFDPPYFRKGKALYKNFFNPEDHAAIADAIIRNVHCDWIVTYDDVPQIETLYQGYPMWKINLRYSISQTSSSGSEIIVFKSNSYCPSQLQLEENKIKLKINER